MKTEYKGNSRKSGVYQIRNLLDEKVYIGSAKEFRKRAYGHSRLLRKGQHHNKHLQAAFDRDCEENFIFEVLEVVEGDRSIYSKTEQQYIDQFLGNWEMCYNFDKKSVSSPRRTFSKTPEDTRKKISEASKKAWETRDRTISEETRQRLSDSHKGKKQSPETIEKRRKQMIGSNHHFFGKRLSKNHRQKLSIAKLGKPSWNKGKTTPEETRKKISSATKGRSSWNKGVARSEETLQKLRKLTNEQVRTIRAEHIGGSSYAVLAQRYSVSKSTIARAISGER